MNEASNDSASAGSSNGESVLQRGVVRLPSGAARVTDADEEVFLLYTSLAGRQAADGSAGFRGLGHIDSHEDTLSITLKIGTSSHARHPGETGPNLRGAAKRKARSRREDHVETLETLEVEIAQDKTALRSRKGDTGSVLWHASVDFAETILQQLNRKDPAGFLDPAILSTAHVVELGAGTGLLSVVLSRYVRHYTVTDIDELIPLIRKNIARNLPAPPVPTSRSKHPPPAAPNVTATALDWVALHAAPMPLRARLVPAEPVDLLLVVDCIYHPSLLPPLLTTIDYLTVAGRTAVVVVVELRAEDVIREFLQLWLDLSSGAEWEIWSVGGLLDGPYAAWVGWKHATQSSGG